jgi:hypothetical protein
MLDNIVSALVAKVLECYYSRDKSKISVIDYLGVRPSPVSPLPSVNILESRTEVELMLSDIIPAIDHWLWFLLALS